MMTEAEFVQLESLLSAMSMYYQQKLPDEVIAMYAEDLADLPYEIVVMAIRSCRVNSRQKKMPLPAEIREIACPKIELSDSAEEQWHYIMRNLNFYNKPPLSEQTQFAVDSCGGWGSLCSMQTEQLGFSKSQFLRAYGAKTKLLAHDEAERRMIVSRKKQLTLLDSGDENINNSNREG